MTVSDNIITLNNDVTGATSENAGIEVERGSSPNVSIRWNETSDPMESQMMVQATLLLVAEVVVAVIQQCKATVM